MTPSLSWVRQRLHFAILPAICAVAFTQTPLTADELDEAIAVAAARPEAPLIPRAEFSKLGTGPIAKLSPDGRFLAYAQDIDGAKQLWLITLDDHQPQMLFSSKILKGVSWSRDSAFIFMETEQGIGMVAMSAPNQPAHVINLDAKKEEAFYGVDITAPHAFIVSQRVENQPGKTLFRVSPNGERTPLYTTQKYVADFLPGATDTSHFSIEVNGAGLDLMRIQDGKTTPILRCSITDQCGLISYKPRTETLYMRGRFGDDLVGLYSVDAHTGTPRRLHRDPKDRFDLNSVLLEADTQTPIFTGYKDDHTSFYGLTPNAQQLLDYVNDQIDARYYHIEVSAGLAHLLIVDKSGDQPVPDISLYDPSTGEITKPTEGLTAVKNASLTRRYLAPRVPIWYTVGDGMRQQGYVTLPLGKNPKTVPLVVVPHGGPWGRTNGSFDIRAQFLANRGYAVFEPNFRASTGFGHQYMVSGRREFGDGRVQQDIIDGMNHILGRGVGSREKLAIFGHSFGGFSVLGALAFTPDIFRVGIAGAPPSDLAKTIDHYRKVRDTPDFDLSLAFYKDQAVDPDDPEDRMRLYEKSPDKHWQQVSKPLYIWAGGKDPKVSVLDVRDYVLRQQHTGKDIMYLEEPAAGHSPPTPIAREAYFYMLEKALAKHVGGSMETAVSRKLERHLKRITVVDQSSQ